MTAAESTAMERDRQRQTIKPDACTTNWTVSYIIPGWGVAGWALIWLKA